MHNELKTRYIVVKLILDTNTFPNSASTKIIRSDSTSNTVAVEATISKATGWLANHAHVTIYGLLNTDIEAFSRFSRTTLSPFAQNWIEIYAGYELDNTGLPTFVYRGQVIFAYPDYNNANRPFTIISQAGIYDATNPVNAYSIQGNVSIDTVLRNIIGQNSYYTYVPRGNLDMIIENPYFYGGMIPQLKDVCSHYGLQYNIDGNQVIVAPLNVPLNKNLVTIDATSGLLGYPVGNDTGFDVKIRFNPAIQFSQYIRIQSYNILANADWYINGIIHTLQTKNDEWSSMLKVNAYYLAGAPYGG